MARRRRRPDRPAATQSDDPEGRERARRALEAALDRGADLEAAAREALRVSDECVEAWLLLADAAPSPTEARERVRRAVAVATRALGERGLREGRGRLADTADGVSYLHAIAALARVQIAEDRAAQAIQSLQNVVAADPRDPVPVRGDLLLLLLATGRDDEAEELVSAYPDERNAEWTLGRALVRRRRAMDEGGVRRATDALDRAIERFPAAAAALVADAVESAAGRAPPVDPLLRQAYEDTDGAIAWVRERLGSERASSLGGATSPGLPAREPVSDVDDRRFSALEHVEEARDAPPERREDLLRAALETWPDCADAWRGLATLANSPAERLARLREAVAAGARALRRPLASPPDDLSRPVGDSEDARSLLAARDALARALREAGDEDDALAEERTLLVEDPDDPFGVGVRHVARLLALGRDAEAEALLAARAEDASPGWVWLRVLAARRRGDRVASSFALAEATLVASFVGPLLVAGGARVTPPEDLSSDGFEEARRAAATLLPAFRATPGALDWLSSVLPRPPPPTRGAPGRGRR